MRDCTITSDGEMFYLSIPGVRNENSSHVVNIPVDRPELLARILVDRHRLLASGARDRETLQQLTIGNNAAPTQHMIECWIKEHGDPNVARKRSEEKAARIENKYGIKLDDIDIEVDI
jgi:hypothetical protein